MLLTRHTTLPFLLVALAGQTLTPVTATAAEQEAPKRKKIVLIAGPKSHGPVGNGVHDYGWSVQLLKVMLDSSNIKDQVNVEIHLDGWPKDPKTLEDMDSLMIISDGRDGDKFDEAPHLASEERVRFIEKQMKRGCGFVTFHFSTFAPEKYRDQVLDWSGGYFQWETDGKRQWYSAITTKEAEVQLGSPDHPISRGLKAFTLREEFYYNIRFKAKDDSLKPVWVVPALNGRKEDGNIVAWARERTDGGRGFGTTCGHFYDNWKQDQFRTMVLNALAWTAKLEVPKQGVQAKYFTHEEITAALAKAEAPIRVLLLAGNEAHKWHNWEKTTQVLKSLLERDPRIQVEVSTDIEDLARKKLSDYQVIVQNYVNWQDPRGLSEVGQRALVKFLDDGGGLLVIHFANGAFHSSLPKADASDWPEYRKIVRRVWDHKGKSGHDPFGRFTVNFCDVKHPIIQDLKSFEVADELYFNQAGEAEIEPLITARSKVTNREEPLAWAYTYGKGRVFQTLLGHSEKTYDAYESREILRRATAWAAGREVRPLDPGKDAAAATVPGSEGLAEGRFGQALDARKGGALIAGRPEYRKPPLTLECWARLFGKQSYNILAANELKSSPTHWELFTANGTGKLSAYLPGMKPDHVHSDVDICDGRWHALGLILEAERVRLFVDGKPVAEQAVEFKGGEPTTGDFAVGMLVGRELHCDGLIDEVRLSRGVRDIKAVPDAAFSPDETTVGLWHFDKLGDSLVADDSKLKNPAKLGPGTPTPPAQGPTPPAGLNFQPADPKLKAVLIDRSPEDAYLAVKVDSQGRVFVAARDAVFLFQPNAKGGYAPRQEVCRFPADSIIIGLEWRGNDLYVLTANALYLLPEGRVKLGVKPKRLVWGLPLDLHVSFHCLAWGPEGDLYLDHGDPLLNYGDFNRPDHWGHWTLYTQPEGTKVTYTGTGAVLRVRPDGSGLRVVAGGLRGPVGLAFDRHWELFSNDNDHESRADLYAPCRLLHVTPGVDFAWPRGWMASKSRDRADLLEPMNADLGRGVPCDLAYYDEPFLSSEYRHSLLMARWDRMTVNRYPLTAAGPTYTAKELSFLEGQHQARPVGVSVGRGGRVFVTALYLGGNVWSPHCYSDLVMLTRADDPSEAPFEPYDAVTASADKLWAELSSQSWERRSVAHKEILRRGGPLLVEATRRLGSIKHEDPALMHLPWLAAASGSAEASNLLVGLLKHPRAEVRLQAVRALAEFPAMKAPRQVFVDALADASPRIQLATLPYFSETSGELPLSAVVKLAGSSDSYLRQTATRVLARRATLAELTNLAKSPEVATRLAAVLAAGIRLTAPTPDYVPPEKLPLNYPHGNAHFTLTFAEAEKPIDLRALARVGSYTTAQWWQAVDQTGEAMALFHSLSNALDDDQPAVQLQAAYFLALLRDPRSEPRIARVRQEVIAKELSAAPQRPVEKVWLVGPFDDGSEGLKTAHPPELGAIDLTAEYMSRGKRTWQEATGNEGRFEGKDRSVVGDRSSSYFYFQLQSVRRQPAQLLLAGEDEVRVWHNGRAIPAGETNGPRHFLLDIQPGSNDVLIRVHSTRTAHGIELGYRAAGTLTPALPEKLGSATLTQRLKESTGGEKIGPEFLRVDWEKELVKGDAVQGRKLFGSLGCAKCHAITAEQKGGGAPSLSEARRRFTVSHVVESVLLPSKQVAEPFRATSLALTNGQVITGLVLQESDGDLELLLPDATRKTIRKKDVEERTLSKQSPMPAGLVKTPEELRHLLAYLLSDNPAPP